MMFEFFKSAWLGWRDFITDGKLAAILLAVLLLLCFQWKRVKRKSFVIYTLAMTIACIVPVTAGVLMLYQTRFYDYQWIWNAVPITAILAYGGVMLFTEVLPEKLQSEKEDKKRKFTYIVTALLCIGMLWIAGGLGQSRTAGEDYKGNLQTAATVLEVAKQSLPGVEITVWAPPEIMGYASAYDRNIHVLYGRNMWDKHLDAYSTDVYSDEQVNLYLWMTRSWERGRFTDEEAVAEAVSEGANCIVLPGNVEESALHHFEEALHLVPVKAGEYYVFALK